jgi:hypothetical protein
MDATVSALGLPPLAARTQSNTPGPDSTALTQRKAR